MEKRVTADEIIDRINKKTNIKYEGYIIEGELDFTSVEDTQMEREFFYRCHVDSELVFIDCVFLDKIIAYRLTIDGVYYGTIFNNNVVFKNSEFKKGVNFNFAKFRKKIEFSSK
jgi:hypothetical protein